MHTYTPHRKGRQRSLPSLSLQRVPAKEDEIADERTPNGQHRDTSKRQEMNTRIPRETNKKGKEGARGQEEGERGKP
jgi:hypothetical protein